MSCPALCFKAGAVEISLYVQPRASRDRIVGLHKDAIKVQLSAPPVDGQANKALLKFMAKKLGLAKRDIDLIAGAESRHKRLRIQAYSLSEVERRLLGESST